jgi:hypothetical protein
MKNGWLVEYYVARVQTAAGKTQLERSTTPTADAAIQTEAWRPEAGAARGRAACARTKAGRKRAAVGPRVP